MHGLAVDLVHDAPIWVITSKMSVLGLNRLEHLAAVGIRARGAALDLVCPGVQTVVLLSEYGLDGTTGRKSRVPDPNVWLMGCAAAFVLGGRLRKWNGLARIAAGALDDVAFAGVSGSGEGNVGIVSWDARKTRDVVGRIDDVVVLGKSNTTALLVSASPS